MNSINTSLLKSLNEKQLTAVTWPNKSALVIAGAGSGKTKVLITRIAWLLHNKIAHVNNILAVTFTNKAALEMKTRLNSLINISFQSMYLGTFHSLCHKILRIYYKEADLAPNFQIIDMQDQATIIKRIIKNLQINENFINYKKLQSFINSNKEKGIRAKFINLENSYLFEQQLIQCYSQYEKICEEESLVDFAELMLRSLELLQTNTALRNFYNEKFAHALIDEFQDTSLLQYKWLKTITGEKTSIFAVGDDDQSIYSFRGANIGNMQSLIQDYNIQIPIKLEQNYRSYSNILNAANAIIANNSQRLGKNLTTVKNKGEKITLFVANNEYEESLFVINEIKNLQNNTNIALNEIAILYRNNSQSRIIEQNLFNNNIPYKIYGGLRFYERQEIKNALAYLRLIINPNDNNSLLRVINFPPRGIGNKTLEEIQKIAQENDISLWETINNHFQHNTKVNRFIKIINTLQKKSVNLNISENINCILEETNLVEYYKNSKENNINRIENLHELLNAATFFNPNENIINLNEDILNKNQLAIVAFLSNAALEAGQSQSSINESIQLMTIHTSKGLEFDSIFLIGTEEGIFPSKFSIDENLIEEERRLMYVAITRVKRKLYILATQKRLNNGKYYFSITSRFIDEIPQELIIDQSYAKFKQLNHNINQNKNIKFTHNKKMCFDGFYIGENVKHSTFGTGIIIDAKLKKESSNLVINFGKHGIKELNTKIAQLEKL